MWNARRMQAGVANTHANGIQRKMCCGLLVLKNFPLETANTFHTFQRSQPLSPSILHLIAIQLIK
jgi:hypothetical protein